MKLLIATFKLYATDPACGDRTPSGTCPCAWHRLWRETAPASVVYPGSPSEQDEVLST